MSKALGSILAVLIVVNGGLPSLGLGQPWVNVAAVVVSAAIAGITFYLKGAAPQ